MTALCADEETRTLNPFGNMLLRHTCIPIPPRRQKPILFNHNKAK